MIDMMEFKGYYGSVHYSDVDQCFFGKIEHIRDLVNYEGYGVHSLKKSFEDSVIEYIEICQSKNKEAEKPFKGSFNIRTGPELHRLAYIYAQKNKISLNKIVILALENYITK